MLQGTTEGTADQPAAIQQNESASQPEDTIQVKVRQSIEKVQKQLPDEAVRHITREKVTYKPDIQSISHSYSINMGNPGGPQLSVTWS